MRIVMLRSIEKIINGKDSVGKKHSKHGTFDFLHLMREWEEIVGPMLAKQTHPLKIGNFNLVVITSHAVYSQQLSYMEKDIISKIVSIYPSLSSEIKSISFQNSPSFFNELKRLDRKSEIEVKSQNLRYSPTHVKKESEARSEFAHIDDEEIRDNLVSLRLQLDQ